MANDAELLEAWRGGDEAAGRDLFRLHFAGVYRFFANKVTAGVDDLVQETFLACVERKEALRDGASFRSFVYAVARRRLYRKWRDENRGAGAIDFGLKSVEDLRPSPSTFVRSARDRQDLLRALRRLPVDLQIALELYYWEGLPSAELATALEIPHGTARSRLRRGRERLRELLSSSAGPLDADVASVRELVSPPTEAPR